MIGMHAWTENSLNGRLLIRNSTSGMINITKIALNQYQCTGYSINLTGGRITLLAMAFPFNLIEQYIIINTKNLCRQHRSSILGVWALGEGGSFLLSSLNNVKLLNYSKIDKGTFNWKEQSFLRHCCGLIMFGQVNKICLLKSNKYK